MKEPTDRDGTRKKSVGSSKAKPKKKATAKKKTAKKTSKAVKVKEEIAPVRNFDNEKPGGYSPEHLIAKLKRIRDASVDTMLECSESRQFKGCLAALQLYEGANRNLDREEAIARGEVPGAGGEISISMPGFDPTKIRVFTPSAPDADNS